MFESIFTKGSLTVGSVMLTLCLALILGFLAALYYAKRNTTTKSFAMTIAVLPLITSTVIMVVNGNLGAGIAVAGSFSLIRFRSAQGSAKEILAVFLSASLGLCLGAGYVGIACAMLIMYLAAMLLLNAVHFGADSEKQKELRISLPEALDYDGLFDDLLSVNFSRYSLEQIRTIEMGTVYQLVYRVTPREAQTGKAFLDAVRERNGNLPVSLGKVPDSREIM